MQRFFAAILLMLASSIAQAELAKLDFMLGEWHTEDFGRGATEFWTSGNSSRAGVFRGELGDGRVIVEFMLIQQDGDDVVLRWNHFNEDFTRWEAEPIEHRLIEAKENYANFEMASPQGGLPRNLVYEKRGDVLTVWVGNLAGDKAGGFELTYQRAKN